MIPKGPHLLIATANKSITQTNTSEADNNRDYYEIYAIDRKSSIAIKHNAPSTIHIPRIMLRPKLFILLLRLIRKLRRPSKRHKRLPLLLKQFQPLPRILLTLIHTIDLHPMTTTCHMQTPIPCTPYIRRLGIERVVPAADGEFEPAFGVDGEIHVPCSPGEFALGGEVGDGDFVPDETAVGTHFYALGPATAAGVGPAGDSDGAVVDDDLFGKRLHDCGTDGHFLDLDSFGVELVVFPDLAVEVEVFF